MKYICTVCGQESKDGNMWCNQVERSACETAVVLEYGEYLGDIKVLRLLRLFRTAAVYEAERQDEEVLLKVAHQGHEDHLKQESAYLASFARSNQPALPTLLPAYRGGNLKTHAYGKAVFRDETKYYEVFEHIQGNFLRDRLLENPQPWYQHIAWILVSLAQVMSFLHQKGKMLHLGISPDVVLIWEDKEEIPRPVLLDLGMALQTGRLADRDVRNIHHHIQPNYRPPETLAAGGNISEASDIYGMGLLFHEMLHGEPTYIYHLRKEKDVLEDVRRGAPPALNRRDLPQADQVLGMIHKALSKNPAQRQQSVAEFGQQVTAIFGGVPKPKRSRFSVIRDASLPVVVLLVVILLVVILIYTLLGDALTPTVASLMVM